MTAVPFITAAVAALLALLLGIFLGRITAPDKAAAKKLRETLSDLQANLTLARDQRAEAEKDAVVLAGRIEEMESEYKALEVHAEAIGSRENEGAVQLESVMREKHAAEDAATRARKDADQSDATAAALRAKLAHVEAKASAAGEATASEDGRDFVSRESQKYRAIVNRAKTEPKLAAAYNLLADAVNAGLKAGAFRRWSQPPRKVSRVKAKA